MTQSTVLPTPTNGKEASKPQTEGPPPPGAPVPGAGASPPNTSVVSSRKPTPAPNRVKWALCCAAKDCIRPT